MPSSEMRQHRPADEDPAVGSATTVPATVVPEQGSSPALRGTTLPQLPQELEELVGITRMPGSIKIRSKSALNPDQPTIRESFELAAHRKINELAQHVAEAGDRLEPAWPSSKTASLLSRICYHTGLTKLWNSVFPVMAYDVVRDEPSGRETKLYRVEISRKVFSYGYVVSVDSYKNAGAAGEIALEKAAVALDPRSPKVISPNSTHSGNVGGVTAARDKEPSNEAKKLAQAVRDRVGALHGSEDQILQDAQRRGLSEFATQADFDNLDRFSAAASKHIEDCMRNFLAGNSDVQRGRDGLIRVTTFRDSIPALTRIDDAIAAENAREYPIFFGTVFLSLISGLWIGSQVFAAPICGAISGFILGIPVGLGVVASTSPNALSTQWQAIRALADRTDSPLGKTLADLQAAGFSWEMVVHWEADLTRFEVKLDIFPPGSQKD